MRDEDLAAFRKWITAPPRGSQPGTAGLYATQVRLSLEDPKGPFARLQDRELAPKTRHTILSALRAWAKFCKDKKLAAELSEVHIPAGRKTLKTPMDLAEWRKFLEALDTSSLPAAQRGVLGVMATRGLRVSDVLRVRRGDALGYLRTGTLTFEAKHGVWLSYKMPLSQDYVKLFTAEKGWEQVVDLVSPTAAKDPWYAARIACYRAVKLVAIDAGLNPAEVYPHRLRRTYAVHFLRQMKGDPEALAKLKTHMGWSDLKTAFGYVDYVSAEALDGVQDEMLKGLR